MSGAAAQAGPVPELSAAPGGEGSAGSEAHDATRYLCSAAHLNPEFTRRAVREVMVAEHRLPAPPFGFDLPTVLRHCVAARARGMYRDTAIVAVLVVALLIAPWTAAAWLAWLAGLRVLVLAGSRRAGSLGQNRGVAARAAARYLAALWVAAGILLLVLVFTRLDPYDIRAVWRMPQLVSAGVGEWIGIPLAAAALCWLAVLGEQIASYVTVAERLRHDGFTPSRWLSAEPAWTQHALSVLGERLADGRLARRPVADPANPFLGAGPQVLRRRWLVELGPATTASAPFDTADLLDRVCERLAAGFGPLDPSGPSGPVSVSVDEYTVSTAPALAAVLGEQTHTSHASVRLLPDAPGSGWAGGGPRTFRRVRVGSDASGLNVTAFLNASAGAGLLQVELYGHVLGAIASRYRVADRTPPFGGAAALRCATRAFRMTPAAVFSAPASAARVAADPILRRHNRAMLAHAAAAGTAVNAGARFDLREAAAEQPGVDQLADEDANLYLAVIERRVREELRPLLPAGSTEF
jgi:hypothetical protein